MALEIFLWHQCTGAEDCLTIIIFTLYDVLCRTWMIIFVQNEFSVCVPCQTNIMGGSSSIETPEVKKTSTTCKTWDITSITIRPSYPKPHQVGHICYLVKNCLSEFITISDYLYRIVPDISTTWLTCFGLQNRGWCLFMDSKFIMFN